MKKIIAFAGSNSSTSINYELVKYTVSKLENYDVQLLNMANMPFPIYSEDAEKNDGFKNSLVELHDDIAKADAVILSVNEHNGSLSAYFKNVIDWLSRFDRSFFEGKKIFLMSTSGSPLGGSRALEVAKTSIPFFSGEVVSTFSLPKFGETFSLTTHTIVDENLKKDHQKALNTFLSAI